ncbi:hypothetical protein [Daejeonella lutea]|uniref:Uncharacterized protein n=1 Tax=Daejeonella lutea TaxID=572036 RepID=A0A1T5B352_9SPHI|nr:hypothetical protein [Daejeonella lutea]SKB41644.1 hypothetical protein SAMN05661099_1243 [Daejeonella lutea]
MYPTIIALHSLIRWFVLISLLYSISRAYIGWLRTKPFAKHDNLSRALTARFAEIQFLLGVILYFLSPIVDYFLHNFKDAIHLREIRFFGMEHITMMIIAVGVITTGSGKVKGMPTDQEKFKTMAIWFSIGLLIILTSIPWPFSPLVSRPWIRTF